MLQNRWCYIVPKTGKNKPGRHMFYLSKTKNTVVISYRYGSKNTYSQNEVDDAFSGMQLGKFLYAKKMGMSAEAVKGMDLHHKAAQWDERLEKGTELIEKSIHKARHKAGLVNRIDVQLGTRKELWWFIKFIDSVDYKNITKGRIQTVNGVYTNYLKKEVDDCKKQYDYYKEKRIIQSAVTVMTYRQYIQTHKLTRFYTGI